MVTCPGCGAEVEVSGVDTWFTQHSRASGRTIITVKDEAVMEGVVVSAHDAVIHRCGPDDSP